MICLDCGKPTFADFDTLGYEIEVCPFCGAQHSIEDYLAPVWTPAPPVAPPPDALCIDGQHQWSTETGVFNILAPGVERFCTLCGCVEYASPPDALARYAAEMYGENE